MADEDEEAKKKAEDEAKKKAKEEAAAKKKAEEEAKKKAEPVRTVCRIKRYYNNILYNPGQPGPMFHGAIPEDLQTSFVKA